MKWMIIALAGLLLVLQYRLWIGNGSWPAVWRLGERIEAQQQINVEFKARNAALDAEVKDLKQGLDAIEERARNELGMIRKGEVFFQIIEK